MFDVAYTNMQTELRRELHTWNRVRVFSACGHNYWLVWRKSYHGGYVQCSMSQCYWLWNLISLTEQQPEAHNDEMIRLWVYTRYSRFPSVGNSTCLSIEHWVKGTLWLYVTCDWQACWYFADEGHFEHFGFEPGISSAAGKWHNH